ncbi:MAG: hypothetical protein R2854_05785 [Caldilineaceae bacterium]
MGDRVRHPPAAQYGYDQARIADFMVDSFALFDMLRHARLEHARRR